MVASGSDRLSMVTTGTGKGGAEVDDSMRTAEQAAPDAPPTPQREARGAGFRLGPGSGRAEGVRRERGRVQACKRV